MLSALMAAAISWLVSLVLSKLSGTQLIILFTAIWWCVFFLSFSWQRRLARAIDSQRPGIYLKQGLLEVPLTDDRSLRFDLDKPSELRYGWSESAVATVASPTMNTRVRLTYATISQNGQQLFLRADESVSKAKAAGWPKSECVESFIPAVRLWANDLVRLIDALRALE